MPVFHPGLWKESAGAAVWKGGGALIHVNQFLLAALSSADVTQASCSCGEFSEYIY